MQNQNQHELEQIEVRKSIAKRAQESIGQNVSFNRIEETLSSTALAGALLLAGTETQQQISSSIGNANDALPKIATQFDCAADSGFLHDNIDKIKLILTPVGIFLLPAALIVSILMASYSGLTLGQYLWSNDKADRDSEKTQKLTYNFYKSVFRTGIVLGLVLGFWQVTVTACVAVTIYHLYRACKEGAKYFDETNNGTMSKTTVIAKVLFELAQAVVSILGAVSAIEFNAIGNAQSAIASAQANQDMSGARDGIDNLNAHYDKFDNCALVMAFASMTALGTSFLLSVRGLYNWVTGSNSPSASKASTTKAASQDSAEQEKGEQNGNDDELQAGDFATAAPRM